MIHWRVLINNNIPRVLISQLVFFQSYNMLVCKICFSTTWVVLAMNAENAAIHKDTRVMTTSKYTLLVVWFEHGTNYDNDHYVLTELRRLQRQGGVYTSSPLKPIRWKCPNFPVPLIPVSPMRFQYKRMQIASHTTTPFHDLVCYDLSLIVIL